MFENYFNSPMKLIYFGIHGKHHIEQYIELVFICVLQIMEILI